MKYEIIDFNVFLDKDSALVPFQNNANCPFEIKRVFYIFGVGEDTIRGEHANRHSQFLLIAIKGSCKVCVDNGFTKEVISLQSPKQGLYLDKMLWKQMYDFSDDCVLLVLSDCYYNIDEYINDYEQSRTIVRGGGVICRELPLVA